MDQIAAQTEKISSYETSRTRRSIVDGNMHSDDSNNDDEFATSGFYVREKTSDKKPESTDKPVEKSVSEPIGSPENAVVTNDSDPKDREDDAVEASASDTKDSEDDGDDDAVQASVSEAKDSEDDGDDAIQASVNDTKDSEDDGDDAIQASVNDTKDSEDDGDDAIQASVNDTKDSEGDGDAVQASANDAKDSEDAGDDAAVQASVSDPKDSEDDTVGGATEPKGSPDNNIVADVGDVEGSEDDIVEESVNDSKGTEGDVVEANVSDPKDSEENVVESSDSSIDSEDDDVVITSVSGPKGTKNVVKASVNDLKGHDDDVIEVNNDSKDSDDVVEVFNDSKGSEDDVVEVSDNDPKGLPDNGIQDDASESKDSTDKAGKVSSNDLKDSAEDEKDEIKENDNDSKDSSNNVPEDSVNELKENGISTEDDSSSPLLNEESSKDDESSKVDQKKSEGDREDDKENNKDLGSAQIEISHVDDNSKNSENKEDSTTLAEEENRGDKADKEAAGKENESALEKTDDNVTSSTNDKTEEEVSSNSKDVEENDVSSTSNTPDETKTAEEPEEKDKSEKPKEDEDDKEEPKQAEKGDSADSSKSKDENAEQPEIPIAKSSILKEQLEKSTMESEDNADHDVEMDEDFDPSLLCPDISMDVDEASVMTTSGDRQADDGSTSPLPYEPIFSTLVDEITGAEVQIDLTPEEMEMRRKMYGPDNPVQATKVHCTACNVHLGSALTGANNRFVHPLLKVLICKNCYHFYTSGEFEKDEDGSELYCRWCGQGGQVLCCSSCEFVFCKRCIRNNFGPKKFKEIRDSDDWNCFRCHPEQLSNLRASCAEFMEYYRTELARAQSLSDSKPELMTTDYTKCCSTPPEKKEETKTAVPKTRRKRKEEEDPDYQEEPPIKKIAPSAGSSGYNVVSQSPMRPIVPKPIPTPVRPVGTTPLRPQATATTPGQGQVFKVGNTTFRTKSPGTPGYTVQRPMTNQGPRNSTPGYITIPQTGSKTTTTPGYIKILPQRMNAPTRPPYTVVSSTSSNNKPTFNAIRPSKPNQMPAMKHEWFEKTVRAAARVNSNLSYTLTQLNRQQSQANSVEGLAMVHNRLQEVLSTSINSLIQIRKNLRTEFIAGIKNTKFAAKPPTAPPTTVPIVVKDDDDVIFVNPTTTISQSRPPPLALSPAVTITKKSSAPKSSDLFSNPKPSTSGLTLNSMSKPAITTTTPSIGPLKGGFLKVRSLTALQTVPSECITIPDDPPVVHVIEEDPLKLDDEPPESTEKSNELKPIKADAVGKKKQQNKAENGEVSSTSLVVDEFMVYDVMKKPPPQVKKMMSAHVALTRSARVDELLQAEGLVNGNSEKRESISSSKPQRGRAAKC